MKTLVAGTTTLVCVVVALTSLAWAPTTLHSPIRPDGLWRWVFIVAAIAALGAYIVGVALARTRPARTNIVVALACAIQLAPVAGPLLLSTDAYTYWAYGRIGAVHGGNPYADTPSEWPDDPAYRRMGANWRETTSLYGPVFTVAAEGHAAVVGDRPGLAARLYKACAALFVLIAAALARRLATKPDFALAFVGWNPVIALHFGGGGHNDALMMVFVLAALALTAAARAQAGGACWAFAIGVKWVPLVLLPLDLLARFRRRSSLGLLGLFGGGAVIAAVAFARYGTDWLTAAGGLSRQARSTGSLGLASALADLGLGHRAILATLGLGFVLAYAFLLRDAWRGRPRLALAAGLFALAQGWFNPWYAIWPVALAATEEDRLARWLALGLSAYALRDALPI